MVTKLSLSKGRMMMYKHPVVDRIIANIIELEATKGIVPELIMISKSVAEEIVGLPSSLWFALEHPNAHLEICGCQVKMLDKNLKYDYIFVGETNSKIKIQEEGSSLSFCCLNGCKYFKEIGVNKTSIYGKCKFRDLNKYVDRECFCEIDKIVKWNEKTLANNKELRDSKEKR